MKVIIAGAREITDYRLVCQAVEASGFEVTEVVSGNCRGVDRLGERWADERKLMVHAFPAKWREQGPSAGPIRNKQMVEFADALIAIPGPESKGTWDIIRRAQVRGLKVYVHRLA